MRSAFVLCLLSLVACNHVVDHSSGGNGDAGGDAAISQGAISDAAVTPTDAAQPTGDLAGCGPCDTPPDGCHAKTGTCTDGACVYTFVDGATCDDGNDCTVGDTCSNSGCFGTPVVCDTAPAAACLSGSSSKTYDAEGTCSGGLCVYTSHTTACSGSCSGGTCSTNACAGITCDAPPSVCYASSGTCASGSCSYAYADGATCDDGSACTTGDSCATGVCQGIPTSCATPPKNTCANATTLKSYGSSGTCAVADGSCSYSFAYVSCPAGCASGACKAAGWTAMTSNTNDDLYGVWGASATQVWAVGQGGVITHYDGTQWEVVTGPSTGGEDLRMIHGTSATNVFAASRFDLFHYDGTSWTKVLRVTYGTFVMTGIWATGNATNDVYISAMVPGPANLSATLMKVTGTTLTTVATTTSPDESTNECDSSSRGIWVNSATDILINDCETQVYDGTTLAPLGSSGDAVGGKFWSSGASSVFSISAGEDFYGTSMAKWDGSAWTLSSTGLDGEIEDLWGTSNKSLYLVGSSASSGAMIYFDGTGFTRQTLPAGTQPLTAVWAASNGKVFAVGTQGTIVTGP